MRIIITKIYYFLFVLALAIISVITGEIVTFVMLGIILMSLININSTLKKIANRLDRHIAKEEDTKTPTPPNC